MKQEVEIRESKFYHDCSVVYCDLYRFTKRKYEYFYDGISEYENRYKGYVPFVSIVVGLFQYCRQNEMGFSRMLQYVKEKLAE